MQIESSVNGGLKIVTIGGGTGNSTLLAGLRPYVGNGLTAVVNMIDDGGSTRELRDEHGALPPGDLRQCLVALSNRPEYWRDIFNYRFSEGQQHTETGLKGHSLGNLIITAAEDIVTRHRTAGQRMSANQDSSIVEAVKVVGEMLGITGQVLPVTIANRRLRLVTADGVIINGEHQAEITNILSLKGVEIGFDKAPTPITPEVAQAITEADVTVIAMGDLYTSIGPALAVDGMRQALQSAQKVVLVCNIMNRGRHTVGFTVADYAAEVERIVGADVLDYVLYNTDQPDAEQLRRYAGEGERLVLPDHTALKAAHYNPLGKPLLSRDQVMVDQSDALAASRSLIRHDGDRTARAIMAIAYGNDS